MRNKEILKLEQVIRSVIPQYGYRNLLLESTLRTEAVGQILTSRRALIEEVMRLTSKDYAEVYTAFAKVLRAYKGAINGSGKAHEKILVPCRVCARPVFRSRNVTAGLCRFHRRSRQFQKKRDYTSGIGAPVWRKKSFKVTAMHQYTEISQFVLQLVGEDQFDRLVDLSLASRDEFYLQVNRYAQKVSQQYALSMLLSEAIVLEVIREKEVNRWQQLTMF